MGRPHYGALDLLRFGAAFAVLLYHFAALGPANGLAPMQAPALTTLARYGYLGVDLFFIISGFVITLSAEGRTARKFLVARGRRLYPAFWAACTLAALATLPPTLHSLWQWLANMTLFAPYLGQANVDGVYWSLYMEVRFYLFVAAIIVSGRFRQLPLFMAGWLALSAANLVHTIPLGLGLLNLGFAPLFVAGAVYSLIARGVVRPWHYALLAGAIALSVAYAVTRHTPIPADPLVIAALTLSFHGVMWLVASGRWRTPAWSLLPWLGALSYPLYLVHNELCRPLLGVIPGGPAVALVGASLAAVALALAVHLAAERLPFQRPRRVAVLAPAE